MLHVTSDRHFPTSSNQKAAFEGPKPCTELRETSPACLFVFMCVKRLQQPSLVSSETLN